MHESHHRDPYRPGRHELGQNHLVDLGVVRDVVILVDTDPTLRRPIVEWAAGDGAITTALAELGRPVEAVEVDVRRLAQLRRRVGPHVAITEGDILRHAPPVEPYDLVSNVPFSITTPVLRRLLRLSHWQRAVLLVQWEVARKRAGVGGATLLTAQWWPWVDAALVRRVGAASFAPRPSVDAGLLLLTRRAAPLLPEDPQLRAGYQRWVADVFTASGRTLPQRLAAAGADRRAVQDWCAERGLVHRLPRDLDAAQWAATWALRSSRARTRPPRRRPR